jgi:lysophospholipase L1-like esterase
LDRLEDKITHLISGIERILTHSIAANQNVRVYAHSYDYPFPDATKGSFLETELINTGIPERMHYDICSEIIDQLDAALVAFAHKHPRNFTRVDLRGVSQKRPENWADEVHLTSSAAARAAKRLYHAIRQHSKIDPVVDPTGTV